MNSMFSIDLIKSVGRETVYQQHVVGFRNSDSRTDKDG
jgi:hypothetical protein